MRRVTSTIVATNIALTISDPPTIIDPIEPINRRIHSGLFIDKSRKKGNRRLESSAARLKQYNQLKMLFKSEFFLLLFGIQLFDY